MNINWNNSVLSSKHENISVNTYFNTLFIKNWSIDPNYLTYFHHCSPSICTYKTYNLINLSYTITLFISLYGGLIIILRFVASHFIDILIKLNDKSNGNINTFRPIQSIKQLNLFKNIQNRTENDIEQQRIITRIYCTLFFGKVILLARFLNIDLFLSLN